MKEVTKKKSYCHNCGSTATILTTFQRKKRKFIPLKKSQRKKSKQTSLNLTLLIIPSENCDYDQCSIEQFLIKYQEETKLKKKDIQLEAGLPQDTESKSLCAHTQDAQTFLVTPTKGIAYIHGTVTNITVWIDNAQHPLINDSGSHFSIAAREYMDKHFTNRED
ncbi:hypothetical protein O181_015070 [Austropuccinia psidii MF-1]|uniref:Uncharacterized protein n=1 Tax=Austropuccinia psidii MF-1 TaxID=1389203 RepID=A0A9Q3C261_9BASI|nr:hypothetical protein [Austropuccinia psidii MF-1]